MILARQATRFAPGFRILAEPAGRQERRGKSEILSAVEESFPVQVALGSVVRAMVVKEFAANVQMASPNLSTMNPAPQPEAGHAQSASATVELTLAPLEPSNSVHRFGPKRYRASVHAPACRVSPMIPVPD